MPNRSTVSRLFTRKDALDQTRLVQQEESLDAAEGEIVLRLDLFSLTTNNITYAAFGDSMRYWQFFPSGEDDWGHMPVWGFADVLDSKVEGIAAGERFYGYFPIASHVRMQPERITPRGFYDGAEHRRTLTSAYNQYTRCSWDIYYSPATEALQILLKPLFLTSSMLADFLEDNELFGARQVVFSSASSKTAYGTAACIGRQAGRQLLGITSPRNLDFVEGLGCYQQSCSYDQLESLASDQPTLYVDFSGDLALRERVHWHFGASLVYSCFAGSAQTPEANVLGCPLGPQPEFFFAPVQIRKRNAEWGPEQVSRHIGEGLLDFYQQVGRPPRPWLRVEESQGYEAARQLITALFHGRVAADEGHVIRL
ncbi:DUF2855 family protein [Pseudomonas sp. BN102]|uniref:DUF2855 family protein n=1 Tax=Pseudomonas sp. BN102 TaxID=2567886 RepID=UPI0024585BEE|nr:DUF2855 family protein [Pseudomonas sp. BN102]MDH4609884.1 DUF2855 family protein [Pseudomonas sp. BN102]